MNYMDSMRRQMNEDQSDYLWPLPRSMRVRLEYCPHRDMLKVLNSRTKELMGYRHTLALQDIEFKVDRRSISTGRAGIVIGTIPPGPQIQKDDIPYPQPEVVLDPPNHGPRFVTRRGGCTVSSAKLALFYACGAILIAKE